MAWYFSFKLFTFIQDYLPTACNLIIFNNGEGADLLERPPNNFCIIKIFTQKTYVYVKTRSSANAKRTAQPLQKYYRGTLNIWELT